MSSSSKGGSSAAASLEKMSIDQLKALKEQADLEVNLLQDSLNNIRTATSRLELASSALNDLSLRPQGFSFPSIFLSVRLPGNSEKKELKFNHFC